MNHVNFTARFTVQSQSNDDLLGVKYVERVIERLDRAPEGDENLFSALCPSMEVNNNFINLLNLHPFTTYERFHIFLIEYKWEHHAKLIIENIIQAGQEIPNVNFIAIDADQRLAIDIQRKEAKLVSRPEKTLHRV